jgi:ABC-2 type transport system permease protein
MYKFKQIFVLDLQNLFTNPMWVAYAIVYPAALILILGWLTSGSYGNVVSSYDYYGVAMMIYAVFNTATYSANSFLEERIKSPNMRIVYSPVRPFIIVLSKALASTVFCSVCYTVVALVLWLSIGINFGGAASWLIIVLLLLTMFLFSMIGVTVCCITKNESITNTIISTIYTTAAVVGGIFFPIEGFGEVMTVISWASPAKWLLMVCFQIIFDQDYSFFLPLCAGLVLLTIGLVILCHRLFRGEEFL